MPPVCLNNISTLQVLTLDYAVAVYPLGLVVLTYILIQLYARRWLYCGYLSGDAMLGVLMQILPSLMSLQVFSSSHNEVTKCKH